MPSKEQEVLDRQRRLADAMKQQRLKQQQQQQQQQQQKEKQAKANSPERKRPAAPPLKRPSSHKPSTLKRPSAPASASERASKRPASTAAVLAAARSKATKKVAAELSAKTKSNSPDNNKNEKSDAVVDLTSSPSDSPVIPRQIKKKIGGGSNKGNGSGKALSAFSSLVKTAGASGVAGGDDDLALSASFNPDDFWKHIRDWDFVNQVYQQLEQQKQPNRDAKNDTKKKGQDASSAATGGSGKSLPDIFLNSRHYVAAWAPLCLAETRAQILSEWLSDLGSGRVQKSCVQVSALMTDDRGPGFRGRNNKSSNDMILAMGRIEPDDSVCLRLNCRQQQHDGNGMSFMTNDIVLLVPIAHKDLFLGVLNGKYKPTPEEEFSDNPFKKWGVVVGHAKVPRKTAHDLLVEVSKRKWAMVPSSGGGGGKRGEESQLYLWKLGSNITALREFTALCRMDQLPLKRFLLGQHLDPHQHQHHPDKKKQAHDGKNKSDLLDQMGGSQALGKGFIAYAQKKFNPSQLSAISSSAHEYGEGGVGDTLSFCVNFIDRLG